MKNPLAQIEKCLVVLQGRQVMLDRDVASLYGVETKRINEAVKNNPDKFPAGYVFALSKSEWLNLRSKFSTATASKTRVLPKAFTEKGLYMLATILKSKRATQTSIFIIETFAKVRAVQQTLSSATLATGNQKNTLLKRGSALMADLLDTALTDEASETTLELNLAVLKLKHTRTRKREKKK